MQLGFKVNLKKCVGCRSCEIACRNEHHLDTPRRSVRKLVQDHEHGYFTFLSMACNHCANPACVAVCPNHCFKKRRDGVVYYQSVSCIGCKSCVGACPFGAPKYNYLTKKIDKCNLCMDRLAVNLLPTCISVCVSEAIELVDISGGQADTGEEWISEIEISRFTKPSLRFVAPEKVHNYFRVKQKGGRIK